MMLHLSEFLFLLTHLWLAVHSLPAVRADNNSSRIASPPQSQSVFNVIACRAYTSKCLSLPHRDARQRCFSQSATVCDCGGCQLYCSNEQPALSAQRCKDDFCPVCGSSLAINGVLDFSPSAAVKKGAEEEHQDTVYSVDACVTCARPCLNLISLSSRSDCAVDRCGRTACRCDRATAWCLLKAGAKVVDCIDRNSTGCLCDQCEAYCARRVRTYGLAFSQSLRRAAMYDCFWRQCDHCTNIDSKRGDSDDAMQQDLSRTHFPSAIHDDGDSPDSVASFANNFDFQQITGKE